MQPINPFAAAAALLALFSGAFAGSADFRQRALAQLEKMRQTEQGMMNIAPSEGEFLAGLVRRVSARRALEIGTSNGYSGIWLALGLSETGGRLITLDIDKGRQLLAMRNFRAAGVEGIVDARLADALKVVPKLEGPFDLVFIDAWKPDYGAYLKMVLPKVRSGGAIVAHNVTSDPTHMEDFLEEIQTNPALKTERVNAGPGGFSVSWKK